MNSGNARPASRLRERARAFIESALFEKSITALIVVNAITLAIETSP